MKKYSVRERRDGTFAEHLLFHRGILSPTDVEKFLSPDYEKHTHDPFLMKGMAKAVERILKAISGGERVAIWSDYDADGIPGGVILHDFFKKIGYANFENYIPHRHNEGFGLNEAGICELAERGAKVLITIDCGIADVADVAYANTLGTDVIITDHHLPNAELPPAFAILNPKQADCAYPEKMLCGSGVVFKLIQALCLHLSLNANRYTLNAPPIGWEKWLLDMVGLATLSDMVPLTGENRVFAQYGLKVLRKSPRIGLMKLLRKLKVDQRELTEDDIGFTITPRINAASRMGTPHDAFHLLSTTDENEADRLSDELNRVNDERKGVVAAMVKEIRKIVGERASGGGPKVIVAGNPRWRPSLLGLAANTLMNEHNCPVFLWGRDGSDAIKGSCRSDGSVSVVALMQATTVGVFAEFGGHALSGGFSVVPERVHFLEEELARAYERAREQSFSAPELFADAQLSLDEVSWDLWRQIEKLAPFGTGNPKPLFLFENVVPVAVEKFGKEKNHLKLIFEKTSGEKVNALSFFWKEDEMVPALRAGTPLSLAAHLERSTFRNYPELRLRIVDIL